MDNLQKFIGVGVGVVVVVVVGVGVGVGLLFVMRFMLFIKSFGIACYRVT